MANNEDRIAREEAEIAELKAARTKAREGAAPDPQLEEAAAVLADPEATPEDKNWAKRHADTKSAWYKEVNELKTQLEAEKNKKAPATDVPTTEEDLAKWINDNPQVAGAINAMASKIAKDMTGGLETQVKELSQSNAQSAGELAKAKILKSHPDFEQVNKTKAFHTWVDEQDPWVDQAVYKGLDAKSIIQAISLYKMENNLLDSKNDKPPVDSGNKQAEEDAASLVARSKVETPAAPKGNLLESTINSWTDEEMEANMPLIAQARAEGRLVLDITRPQR